MMDGQVFEGTEPLTPAFCQNASGQYVDMSTQQAVAGPGIQAAPEIEGQVMVQALTTGVTACNKTGLKR